MIHLSSERWITPSSGSSRRLDWHGSRRLRVTAISIAAVVVQHGVMPDITIFGVHPDLLLLLSLVVAITGGADRGATAGFASGLATDVFLSTPLGLSALAYALAAYGTGVLAADADDLPWTVGGLAALGTAAGVSLYVMAASLLGGLDVSATRWLQVTVILVALNALLAPMLAPLLARAWRTRRPTPW